MQLQKGAFGRVFLAKKDGKEYALKETLSSGRKATKAAQRESKLMVELDHINIVKLYEYFTFGHPAKCFMIMAWFPLSFHGLIPGRHFDCPGPGFPMVHRRWKGLTGANDKNY